METSDKNKTEFHRGNIREITEKQFSPRILVFIEGMEKPSIDRSEKKTNSWPDFRNIRDLFLSR